MNSEALVLYVQALIFVKSLCFLGGNPAFVRNLSFFVNKLCFWGNSREFFLLRKYLDKHTKSSSFSKKHSFLGKATGNNETEVYS